MTVMAASVHLTGCHRGIIEGVLLNNRQCIHICSNQNRRAILISLKYGDHSGFADSGLYFQTQPGKFLSNDTSGANFLKGQFWVLVKITAARHQFIAHRISLLFEIYVGHSCSVYR